MKSTCIAIKLLVQLSYVSKRKIETNKICLPVMLVSLWKFQLVCTL